MLEPITESETNHNHMFDPFKSINDQRDHWRSGSFGARARKTGENYQSYRNSNGEGVQFRPQNSQDESGVHSPPLWQSSPPRSPSHPSQNPNTYRSLSPTSRTQAIARGQRELMEMVKNMPESCYELSLKDLVEHHPRMGSPKEDSCLLEDKNYDEQEQVLKQRAKSIRRQDSKNNEKKSQILRSGSMENRDLFLKMVFPVSFKSRKKKNLITNNTSSRVSPKPEVSDKTSKTVDKDWWKKRFSGSSGSESGITSSNNSGSTDSSGSSSIHSRSSSGRKKMGFLRSCFSCFYSTKSNSGECSEKKNTTIFPQ